MAEKLKRQAKYIFVNPNDSKDVEKALHQMILDRLLAQKFSFQQPMREVFPPYEKDAQ